jgi:hypothetical protein
VTYESKLTRARELIAERDRIDAELESIFGGAVTRARAPQKCSKCGVEGHTARFCPREENEDARSSSTPL